MLAAMVSRAMWLDNSLWYFFNPEWGIIDFVITQSFTPNIHVGPSIRIPKACIVKCRSRFICAWQPLKVKFDLNKDIFLCVSTCDMVDNVNKQLPLAAEFHKTRRLNKNKKVPLFPGCPFGKSMEKQDPSGWCAQGCCYCSQTVHISSTIGISYTRGDCADQSET